jgi:hypothetical protein
MIFVWGPTYTMYWDKTRTGIPAVVLGTYVAWRSPLPRQPAGL